jgi:hypothetical protein
MLLTCYFDQNMFLFVLLLLSCITLSHAKIVDNGKLAIVDGINYYVGGIAVSKLVPLPSLNLSSTEGYLVPLTVVRSGKNKFTYDDMKEVISNFTRSDDVFQRGFTEGK